VHTEFNDLARRPNEHGDRAPALTYIAAEEVARFGLDGIERNTPVVIPGMAMKLAMLLIRLMPMPVLRLALRTNV